MVASAERLKKVMPDGKLKVRWDEMDDCYIVSIPSGKHSFYPVLEGHQGGDGREGKEVCEFFVAAYTAAIAKCQ